MFGYVMLHMLHRYTRRLGSRLEYRWPSVMTDRYGRPTADVRDTELSNF